jgi:hypothetical protein
MRIKKLIRILLLPVLALTSVYSQGIDIDGENTDLFQVNPGGLWGTGTTRVDSVYLGAAFLRDTTKSFQVWLSQNEAMWEGSLYLFIPHGSASGTDTSIFLFKNLNNSGPTLVNLVNNPIVREKIRHNDTIFFKYVSGPTSAPLANTGYTGPNRAPGEGWKETDYVYSPDTSTRTLTGPGGMTFRVGRRWCTAGWIRNLTLNKRTDTVQFAFEDSHKLLSGGTVASDFDFDDMMFKITGISLIHARPDKIEIRSLRGDTLSAGDTLTISGTVYDISGSASTAWSDSITWTIVSSSTLTGDILTAAQGDSTCFTATAAHHRVCIIGTYRDSMSGFSDTAWITVVPAAPSQVDIALKSPLPLSSSQVLVSIGKYAVQQRLTVYVDSGQTMAYAYAVLRDRFNNFAKLADSAVWSSGDIDTITVAGTGNKQYEGAIVQTVGARRGSTLIFVTSPDLPACRPDTALVVLRPDKLLSLRLVNAAQPTAQLDSIRLAVNGSMTLKVQGIWATAPALWVNVDAVWAVQTEQVRFDVPPPLTETNAWLLKPIAPGMGTIIVSAGGNSISVPVIVVKEGSRIMPRSVQNGVPDSKPDISLGERLKIRFPISGSREIKVLSLSGQCLCTHVSDRQNISVEIPGLSKGLYMVVIRTLDRLKVEKYVVPYNYHKINKIK